MENNSQVNKKEKTEVMLTKNGVPAMLERTITQIKILKEDYPPMAKASKVFPGLDRYIENIDSIEVLIEAASVVMSKRDWYNKAAKKVVKSPIKVPEFKLNGHTPEEWLEDIENRIKTVDTQKKIEALEKIKKKLERNLSEEHKLNKDLQDIQNIMENL